MGRKKLPAGEVREVVFQVRLTRQEKARIDARAAGAGLDSGTWARHWLLKEDRSKAILDELQALPVAVHDEIRNGGSRLFQVLADLLDLE